VTPAPLVYGLTWQKKAEPIGRRVADFVGWLSRESGVRLVPRVALSYEELVRMVRSAEVDVAWLPPIVFLALEDAHAVEPLVEHSRESDTCYQSVLLVREESGIRSLDDLKDTRAAWVDPFSAAGYVLPRIELAGRGVDPRRCFIDERFFGSHDAAVRALVEGKTDVTGTFAHVGEDGRLLRGAWSDLPEAAGALRVLATFGPIPADVTAARTALPVATKTALRRALVAASTHEKARPLARAVFGVDVFRRALLAHEGADAELSPPSARADAPMTVHRADARYNPLRRAMEVARSLGLLPTG